MADVNLQDDETESVLRRSELVRRSIRQRRNNTTDVPSRRVDSVESNRYRAEYRFSPTVIREAVRISPPPVIHEQKNMTSSGSKSGVLAQQIHEEFLICKICLEGFKNPKSLSCLHTFCEECVENHANSESSYKKYSDYREFTCPLCRKRTTLPVGGVKKLPDNFLVASLGAVIERQKPSQYPFCDICKLVSRKHKEASSKCLDCNKLLCQSCVDQHLETKVTKNHNVFDVEIEKEIECKEHTDEVVRFYCETCETAICILCTFNDHKDHEVAQFSDAVIKYKSTIEELLHGCQEQLDRFTEQLGVISECESCIRSAEQKIRDVSIDMISDIRTRERILLEEIQNIYGSETMELIKRKDALSTDLDALKSTVNLTEIILKGKDMELLLLKKEVQTKLETLSQSILTSIPNTASKKITFMPGSVDMGFILDSDRPNLSRRPTLSRTNQVEDFALPCEMATQTDSLDTSDCGINTSVVCTVDEDVQTDEVPESRRSRRALRDSEERGDAPRLSSQRSFDGGDEHALRRQRRRERARTARQDSQVDQGRRLPPVEPPIEPVTTHPSQAQTQQCRVQ